MRLAATLALKRVFAFYMIRRIHVPLVFGARRSRVGADSAGQPETTA
jgi:hypothetical protein